MYQLSIYRKAQVSVLEHPPPKFTYTYPPGEQSSEPTGELSSEPFTNYYYTFNKRNGRHQRRMAPGRPGS